MREGNCVCMSLLGNIRSKLSAAEFERIYSTNGAWTERFRKAEGYQNTELLRESNHQYHYSTMDRSDSSKHYEVFLSQMENRACSAGCAMQWVDGKGITFRQMGVGFS